jgi:hypothetical protein
MSGMSSVESHPASGIAETTFVGQWLCLYFPSEYSYFGAHLTRRDGHLPICSVRVQTQKTPAFIPNPSIAP